jgi:hypothetical protein
MYMCIYTKLNLVLSVPSNYIVCSILPGRVGNVEAGKLAEKGSTTGVNLSGVSWGLRLTHPIRQGIKNVPWELHIFLQSSTESSSRSVMGERIQ